MIGKTTESYLQSVHELNTRVLKGDISLEEAQVSAAAIRRAQLTTIPESRTPSITPWTSVIPSTSVRPLPSALAGKRRHFVPPFLVADPLVDIQVNQSVLKISTALSDDTSEISAPSPDVCVGYGTIGKILRPDYDDTFNNFTPNLNYAQARFYRGMQVFPKSGGSLLDQSTGGNSGSLVFLEDTNQFKLVGMLSGASSGQPIGSWIVHFFSDIVDAFDGLLSASPVTFTESELEEFLKSGTIAKGCGLYE